MKKFVAEKNVYYADGRGWRLMDQRVVYAPDKNEAAVNVYEMWGWWEDEETSILITEVHA